MPPAMPALSVLARPSRMHRLLLGAAGLAQSIAAAAIAADPAYYLGAPVLALAPALAAVMLFGSAACRPKTHQIDFSGTGEVRVTVQRDVRAPNGGTRREAAGEPQRLLSGSVFRPLLMVLRCGAPDGAVHVLIVWRNALDAESWRSLAVALDALGRHGRAGQAHEKIR